MTEHDDSHIDHDKLIAGHRYDGIREYDNPMPGWWIWLFIGGIVFGIFYVIAMYGFDAIDSYTDDLEQSVAKLQAVRDASSPTGSGGELDEATLLSMIADADVAAGATLFAQQCAVCHGAEGQGVIGPNLTDNYYIHGSSDVETYNVITEGVLDKGMPPWEAVYTEVERAQLVAFINSIVGSNPAGAKAAEGTLAEAG